MTLSKEELCISALDKICKSNFEPDEFSLHGPKESAVCMEKTTDGWSVYESERNSHNDMHLYDNIVEAGLDLLRRLSTSVNYNNLKDAFLEAIIGQQIA